MKDVPESSVACAPVPAPPIRPATGAIRILPADVVARIAAGEVVERPASIVKELVENALDAGATRIDVEIAGGGRNLVRVSDDGRGMPPADLALCALAHATSKLRAAEELDALKTLGFRGEALPSIAAVSKFSVVSRVRPETNAWKIAFEGGRAQPAAPDGRPEVRPAAGPFGTTVEARELFFNTPVRARFMKAAPSEAAACADTLLRLALTRPDAAFALKQERLEIFNLPASCAPGEADPAAYLRRAREALGRDTSRTMIEIALEGPGTGLETETPGQTGYRLFGLISPPADSRPNRNHIYLSVNGRTVRDRTLTSALLEACRHLLPPRRYPAAVLYLDIPAADVDVNVHPTKAEVRFRIPGLIFSMLHRAVRLAFGLEGGHAVRTPAAPAPFEEAAPGEPTAPAPSLWPRATPAVARFAPDEALFAGTATAPPAPPVSAPGAETTDRVAEARAPFGRPLAPAPETDRVPASPAAARSFRVLAQAGRMYIVLEDASGVKLIDQHALHERVLFETFLERAHGRARGDAQGLLIPETIDLSPAQAAAFNAHAEAREVLANLGFDAEAFGARALLVRAVPAILKSQRAATFVRDVLDALAAPDESAPRNSPLRRGHFRERAAYMLSCKGAIKAGERLSVEQMTALMDAYYSFAGTGPLTCPHGRPLALELGWEALERAVGR